MKFGSSFTIEVRGLWEKDALYKASLTLDPDKLGELDDILREISSFVHNEAKTAKKLDGLTDDELIRALEARNYSVKNINAPKSEPSDIKLRVYIPSSKSGGRGHYIYVDNENQISCSCPGYFYNKKCWASDKVGIYLHNIIDYRMQNPAYTSKFYYVTLSEGGKVGTNPYNYASTFDFDRERAIQDIKDSYVIDTDENVGVNY